MIKKFHASTTRDALRAVRDALGANAIILSNRPVEGGVEIIAVADLDMAALTENAEPVTTFRQRPRSAAPSSAYAEAASSAYRQTQAEARRARPAEPLEPANIAQPSPFVNPRPTIRPASDYDQANLTSFTEYLAQREASTIRPTPARQNRSAPRPAPAAESRPAPARPPQPPQPPQPPADNSPVMQELAREVRILRALVEGQLAGLAWGEATRSDPNRGEVMKRLLAVGFSPALTRQLLEKMPAGQSLEKLMKWVRAALAHNLRVTDPTEDLVDRGGVFALVGPTGVGKTTTVAKLAARAVLKHGAARVAMVTTDSYRIGAQDQLRIYGRILGTPVFAVRDENELELTLLDLAGKHVVFIDTIGMSQRDRRVAEQIAMLSGDGKEGVRRLLLLGAPSQGITLEEVVRAYSGPGLTGCVLTKIDEALTFGPVLDTVIRHQLRIHYVTNGQRVPEDLHLANGLYLVDRAFRLGGSDPVFVPEEEDYPVLVAAAESQNPTRRGPYDERDQGAFGATG